MSVFDPRLCPTNRNAHQRQYQEEEEIEVFLIIDAFWRSKLPGHLPACWAGAECPFTEDRHLSIVSRLYVQEAISLAQVSHGANSYKNWYGAEHLKRQGKWKQD